MKRITQKTYYQLTESHSRFFTISPKTAEAWEDKENIFVKMTDPTFDWVKHTFEEFAKVQEYFLERYEINSARKAKEENNREMLELKKNSYNRSKKNKVKLDTKYN